MSEPEQLELPLEFPTYDHFTIKLSKGDLGALETVRTHTARNEEDALNFVDSMRDYAQGRDNVTWQGEEPDAGGLLYGLAPGGVVYEISVVPPFSQGLS